MEDKVESIVKVKNTSGLHLRPASMIVQLVSEKKVKVKLTYKDKSVHARNVMDILSFAIPKGAKIKVQVEGPNAKQVLCKLVQAFNNKFGENQ